MKTFIGDAIYAELIDDGSAIILTTENGIEVTNRIVIEAGYWHLLHEWLEAQRKRLRR